MAKISTRRNRPGCSRLIDMFSPEVTAPVRSSPSSLIHGGRSSDPNELPSACTTPLLPSDNSYRQPRSRPTPLGAAAANRLKNPPPVGAGAPCDQFRLIRIVPDPPPDFVSDICGAAWVSVTFCSEIDPEPPGVTDAVGWYPLPVAGAG